MRSDPARGRDSFLWDGWVASPRLACSAKSYALAPLRAASIAARSRALGANKNSPPSSCSAIWHNR
jgi:hypothetical protein